MNTIRKKQKFRKYGFFTLITLSFLYLFIACGPIREFNTWKEYDGKNDFPYDKAFPEAKKKNIFIIADNKGTEIFDLMAPFYLFNATGKANVFIVAPHKRPIIMRKGLFILPQLTFTAVDSLSIFADAIVIPNLSAMDAKHQDPFITNWIKQHYTPHTRLLSVCDGSLTAAATGLYDGKLLTTHASDMDFFKTQYPKPDWVENISVTHVDNLYSTAGVSNAVEGSLFVIKAMFGDETMQKVISQINYPGQTPKIGHRSDPIRLGDKVCIANKVLFKRNNRVGVFLENNIDEFKLAAILDTYNRTFPKSIESFSPNDEPVTSMYGLTIIPTGASAKLKVNEIHLVGNQDQFKNTCRMRMVVGYPSDKGYIFNQCLTRIDSLYGKRFGKVVKKLLDYN